MLAVGGWIGCAVFLTLSLFFKLAALATFVGPSLWCALLCGGVALVMTVAGVSFLKPPR